MEWQLIINKNAYQLLGSRIVIGRAEHCDIVIDDQGVSSQHAQLEKTAEGWILTDLGSTNGTKVNSKSVQSAEIYRTSILKFGSVEAKLDNGINSPLLAFQLSPNMKPFALGAGAAVILLFGLLLVKHLSAPSPKPIIVSSDGPKVVNQSASITPDISTPRKQELLADKSIASQLEKSESDTIKPAPEASEQDTQTVNSTQPEPIVKPAIPSKLSERHEDVFAIVKQQLMAVRNNVEQASSQLEKRNKFVDIYKIKEDFDYQLKALPGGYESKKAKEEMIEQLLARVKKNRRFRKWYENPKLIHWAREYAKPLSQKIKNKVLITALHESLLFQARDLELTAVEVLRPFVQQESMLATLYTWHIERDASKEYKKEQKKFLNRYSHLLSGLSHRMGYFADFILYRLYFFGEMDENLQWVIEPDSKLAQRFYENMRRNHHWLGLLTQLEFCNKKLRYMECPSQEKANEMWKKIADDARHPKAQEIYAYSYWENTDKKSMDSRFFSNLEKADLYGSFKAHEQLALYDRKKPVFIRDYQKIGAFRLNPKKQQTCKSEFGSGFVPMSWHDLLNLSPKRRINMELVMRDARATWGNLGGLAAVSYQGKSYNRKGEYAYSVQYFKPKPNGSWSKKRPSFEQDYKGFLHLYSYDVVKPAGVLCFKR